MKNPEIPTAVRLPARMQGRAADEMSVRALFDDK